MNTRFFSRVGLFVTATLLALTLLGGCRAFEPETVIVNLAPETYIIGSPMDHGGGFYHFHVYWYGTDRDGTVDKFVWAVTDTTLQDEDTVEDEEDQNFNPALDASQLAIGHWTTKTDSIFDFKINQGVGTAYDMTLHMVAMDNFGDMDRTPARLHFFSNSLGNPEISFFRIAEGDTQQIVYGQVDTLGFSKKYQLMWKGSSPNVYDTAAMARIDTVYPFDDGLFGYKWKISGELGGNCLPSLFDCWNPRKFNEAEGDSFSYFGNVTSLTFFNDDTGTSPFRKRLVPGPVTLQINSIDVAGVEVAEYMRELTFMVNYDPETLILDFEQDWAHPEDEEVYPYYIRLNDSLQIHTPFRSGQRIPDRSYVVFKALGRDATGRDGNPLDEPRNTNYKMGLTGYVNLNFQKFGGGSYSLQTSASELDTVPLWGKGLNGWYADTLGFLVGPSAEITLNMQSVDEHGQRDGTPATFSFHTGFAPCVQCLEVVPTGASSAFDSSLDCYYPDGDAHPCFGETTDLFIKKLTDLPVPGRTYLTPGLDATLAVDKLTKHAFIAEMALDPADYYLIDVYGFTAKVIFHGKDHEWEEYVASGQEKWRTMAWKTQINYENDSHNTIRDGGGADNIDVVNWGVKTGETQLEIDDNGLWIKTVKFYVPKDLLDSGFGTSFDEGYSPGYRWTLQTLIDGQMDIFADLYTEEIKDLIEVSTRQFGLGWVQGIALDQTQCNISLSPTRPGFYHTFKGLRPLISTPPGFQTWRDCLLETVAESSISLDQLAMGSLDDEPAVKYFRVTLQLPDEVLFPEVPE